MTDGKKIKDELARQMLRIVVENSETQVFYLDRNLNFVLANKAFVKDCGYSWDTLKGKNYFDFFPSLENQTVFHKVRDTGRRLSFKGRRLEYSNQPQRGVTVVNQQNGTLYEPKTLA